MKNIGATLGHIRDTRTMRRQEKHLVTGKKEILIILVPLITIQKNHTKFHLISREFNAKNGRAPVSKNNFLSQEVLCPKNRILLQRRGCIVCELNVMKCDVFWLVTVFR